MGKLDGKVAAITGAGRGIGRALAKAMAAKGAAIVVNDLGVTLVGDREPTSPANDVVAEIKAAGGRAVANLGDISTMEGGKGLVDQAVKEFGKLDILVNLAGVIRDRMIFNMGEEDWDKVLDRHLKGTFCTSRFASAHMRERRSGRIINFSSERGVGQPGSAQLCRGEGGNPGADFQHRQRLAPLWNYLQRDLSGGRDANDRYDRPAIVPADAERARPREHRAIRSMSRRLSFSSPATKRRR